MTPVSFRNGDRHTVSFSHEFTTVDVQHVEPVREIRETGKFHYFDHDCPLY